MPLRKNRSKLIIVPRWRGKHFGYGIISNWGGHKMIACKIKKLMIQS